MGANVGMSVGGGMMADPAFGEGGGETSAIVAGWGGEGAASAVSERPIQ